MQTEEENTLDTLEVPAAEATASKPVEDQSATLDMHSTPEEAAKATTPTPELPRRKLFSNVRVRGLLNQLNIYLLLFAIVVLLAIGAIIYGVSRSSRDNNNELESISLTDEELANLKGTDATVGDPRQILNIESNAIFSGKVLVRDDLDVAGTIRVGGALNLPGITVAGNSSFDEIQANQLSVSGDTSLQGQVNIQQNLSVTGSASFGGTVSAPQLNIQTLQLSGDLQLNRHIDAGGATPGRSNGSALGSGGTSSVNGTDTAGTVTINTGSNPAAGCYINVSFSQNFNATPHVVITPVGSAGASLNYYINRSSTGFSVCSTTPPAAGSSFSFDYIAID